MTNVTCGLTAKKPGSAPCSTLVIEYETTLLFTGIVIISYFIPQFRYDLVIVIQIFHFRFLFNTITVLCINEP